MKNLKKYLQADYTIELFNFENVYLAKLIQFDVTGFGENHIHALQELYKVKEKYFRECLKRKEEIPDPINFDTPFLATVYRYVNDPYSNGLKACQFQILNKTRCGMWVSTIDFRTNINYHPTNKQKNRIFVNDYGQKKFAHFHQKDALMSFIRRKKRQLSILYNQNMNAQREYDIAVELMKKLYNKEP